MLTDWQEQMRECARLRCRHVDETVTAGDIAGAATGFGAVLPLLRHRPPCKGCLGFFETTGKEAGTGAYTGATGTAYIMHAALGGHRAHS
jgi:hypothetical protein